MATCLKRSSSLLELICPVCRTILREPVTLPCAHNLCLRCLQGTVQHNSLTCPLCRQRLGSWLRAATKSENLVNAELWQLIRRSFPRELDQAASVTAVAGTSSTGHSVAAVDFDAGFIPKKILSAAGEIRREYEIQLQLAQEEMQRQQEKERLASEVLIRKLQEDEEQEKLMLLAQDQLLAKTLAKRECSISKNATTVSVDKPSQSKPATNQKMSVKKQNVAPISKIRSEKYLLNAKTNPANVQKESQDTFGSYKPVPIHNAVTRVVTHQSRLNQPNNSTYSAALGELVGSTSKIYGLQSKEELQVPSDVLSSKKKKLGVEVCITNVEGEERIGSAESAGSHDSINQEIHHFKPIKALPRTPLKVTDGRQFDLKLIRVLATYKKITNAVLKPPVQTNSRKTFGCSWSAFKRISRKQVLQKEPVNIYQETKKTEKKLEPLQTVAKSSKLASEVEETSKRKRNIEVAFDSNENYTKKIVNGIKVSKKFNIDEQTEVKSNRRIGNVKNGLVLGKHKSNKVIEVVNIDDDEPAPEPPAGNSSLKMRTPDPLAFTPKNDTRQPSPFWEMAIENIAERIKRRKTSRTTSNTENIQSAINLVKPAVKSKNSKPAKKSSKPKVKKTSTAGNKTAATKAAKAKTKTPKTTTITSQIKRLAARSSKRPRYTEDSESEPEDLEPVVEQPNPEPVKQPEPEKLAAPSPSPRKKPRKNAKPRRNKPKSPDDDAIIKEQERLERLAAQEREDRELALRLQAQFDAMERTPVRTRRGVANRVMTPVLMERRPQKRALVE
ncbi:titin-like [Phymastichus coffea]|uniref:titin-like n=1 Tax=Phymastichus coffea TaxID=108790 RepID=UPI00273B5AE6|nr:titin-like [Phymastichus coffea]